MGGQPKVLARRAFVASGLAAMCAGALPRAAVAAPEEADTSPQARDDAIATLKRQGVKDAVVVTIFCDSAAKYLSESFWREKLDATEAENWP